MAYGSDGESAEVLIKCAKSHPQVGEPRAFCPPDFGDSQLSFSLQFFSTSVFAIDNVSSDLRFSIVEAFEKNKISIPFPQRDIHIKSQPLTFDRSDLHNNPPD